MLFVVFISLILIYIALIYISIYITTYCISKKFFNTKNRHEFVESNTSNNIDGVLANLKNQLQFLKTHNKGTKHDT